MTPRRIYTPGGLLPALVPQAERRRGSWPDRCGHAARVGDGPGPGRDHAERPRSRRAGPDPSGRARRHLLAGDQRRLRGLAGGQQGQASATRTCPGRSCTTRWRPTSPPACTPTTSSTCPAGCPSSPDFLLPFVDDLPAGLVADLPRLQLLDGHLGRPEAGRGLHALAADDVLQQGHVRRRGHHGAAQGLGRAAGHRRAAHQGRQVRLGAQLRRDGRHRRRGHLLVRLPPAGRRPAVRRERPAGLQQRGRRRLAADDDGPDAVHRPGLDHLRGHQRRHQRVHRRQRRDDAELAVHVGAGQ